ncbi:MAG: ornithine carbamoyltransferase [Clostridia bacterium]|nr:ornithine carbamoyltransferase [Clostridia bacterium]
MKHLMRLSTFSEKEILEILNIADQLKFERKNNIKHKLLKGKTLGMFMNNSASSTRASFEVGMYDLGGHALLLSDKGISEGKWDNISDFAAVLTRFVDGIAVRTDNHEDAEAFAEGSIVPVINTKSDKVNPCQALADLMTIRERKGSFKGRKLCCVGSGSSVNSIIVGAIKMGMAVCVAAPENHKPDAEIMQWAQENGEFFCTDNVTEAAKDADVIYIEAWSKGETKGYTVDKTVMEAAKDDAILLHCLPIHRGEEITEDVLSKHQNVIYDQAENRMHAEKAVLVKLLGNNKK